MTASPFSVGQGKFHVSRPTAAKGGFPYPHATLAEIYDEDRMTRTRPLHVGDRGPSLIGVTRTTMPDRPCPQCGARGFCGHHQRIAA